MVENPMTFEEATEWVKAHIENDGLNRSELEAAYVALMCGGDTTKSDAELWSNEDLRLFCRGEIRRPTSLGHNPPMCIADMRDLFVKMADSGVLIENCSHACLRAASTLVRLRLAIFFWDSDIKRPITEADEAAAYRKIRELILFGE